MAKRSPRSLSPAVGILPCITDSFAELQVYCGLSRKTGDLIGPARPPSRSGLHSLALTRSEADSEPASVLVDFCRNMPHLSHRARSEDNVILCWRPASVVASLGHAVSLSHGGALWTGCWRCVGAWHCWLLRCPSFPSTRGPAVAGVTVTTAAMRVACAATVRRRRAASCRAPLVMVRWA